MGLQLLAGRGLGSWSVGAIECDAGKPEETGQDQQIAGEQAPGDRPAHLQAVSRFSR